jgi:hypothetical protein
MPTLVVPAADAKPWPTLGPSWRCSSSSGPSSVRVTWPGNRPCCPRRSYGLLEALYEVYPKGSQYPGRRRFKRAGWSVRKGLAKTEFGAWVTFLELHPEAPVRFDHWATRGEESPFGYRYKPGEPVGRPVMSPYIPMLAYNKDQVEELAFGALAYIIGEGPDADLFDVSLERIIRLSPRGRTTARRCRWRSPRTRSTVAVPRSSCSTSRTACTCRGCIEAHNTMANNLTKRPAADAWSFYVGTAGQLGQKSIAEQLYSEARR